MEKTLDELKHLGSSRLFHGLGESDLSELLQISQLEMFDAGEFIFREGEIGDQLFVVVDGKVRISLDIAADSEETLAVIGPGNSFGEMTLIGEEALPRSASAIAHVDCVVLALHKNDILVLLEADHDIAYVVFRNLLTELSAHVRAANDKLIFMSSAGRF